MSANEKLGALPSQPATPTQALHIQSFQASDMLLDNPTHHTPPPSLTTMNVIHSTPASPGALFSPFHSANQHEIAIPRQPPNPRILPLEPLDISSSQFSSIKQEVLSPIDGPATRGHLAHKSWPEAESDVEALSIRPRPRAATVGSATLDSVLTDEEKALHNASFLDPVPPELKDRMDDIFLLWLRDVCNDCKTFATHVVLNCMD